MNAVGKMLVVLQLCLSLLFVCFAGAVYSLQGRWRDDAEKAQAQIRQLQNDMDSAREEHQRALDEAVRLREEAEEERDSLREQLASAEERAATAEALNADLRQERDKAIAENILAADEAQARRTEAVDLRRENASLTATLAEHLEIIRRRENELIENAQKLRSYETAEQRHLEEIARLTEILRSRNIDPNTRVTGDVRLSAEKVDGRVIDRLQNSARTREFVRITIGANDGVEKDMILTVYRKDQYICDVRVIEVEADSAAAIVLEKTRRSYVQRGDYVTTQL